MFPKGFYFDADGGNGGQPPAEPPADPAKITFTPEQQAHIDAIIGRAKAKWADDTKAAQDAAKKKAEEDAAKKRLEEEKEYQKLLDIERAKIAELEPLSAQVETINATLEKYRATVGDILTKRVEALGDTAKNAVDNLPGEPDALAKLQWLNANEALFKATEAPPVTGGTPPRRPAPARTPQPTINGTTPAEYEPVIRF